jgi:hypothetical protein
MKTLGSVLTRSDFAGFDAASDNQPPHGHRRGARVPLHARDKFSNI